MTQEHVEGRKAGKEEGELAVQGKASSDPERCRVAELLLQG